MKESLGSHTTQQTSPDSQGSENRRSLPGLSQRSLVLQDTRSAKRPTKSPDVAQNTDDSLDELSKRMPPMVSQ